MRVARIGFGLLALCAAAPLMAQSTPEMRAQPNFQKSVDCIQAIMDEYKAAKKEPDDAFQLRSFQCATANPVKITPKDDPEYSRYLSEVHGAQIKEKDHLRNMVDIYMSYPSYRHY